MKSTPAIKNIRKYKNKINGKPKRVTTGVDDYGNRFHVVGGKVKHSRSLSENKKAARKMSNEASSPKKIGKITRQADSSKRRMLISDTRYKNGIKQTPLQKGKQHYARNRMIGTSSHFNRAEKNVGDFMATENAKRIHNTKRKAKDFT